MQIGISFCIIIDYTTCIIFANILSLKTAFQFLLAISDLCFLNEKRESKYTLSKLIGERLLIHLIMIGSLASKINRECSRVIRLLEKSILLEK